MYICVLTVFVNNRNGVELIRLSNVTYEHLICAPYASIKYIITFIILLIACYLFVRSGRSSLDDHSVVVDDSACSTKSTLVTNGCTLTHTHTPVRQTNQFAITFTRPIYVSTKVFYRRGRWHRQRPSCPRHSHRRGFAEMCSADADMESAAGSLRAVVGGHLECGCCVCSGNKTQLFIFLVLNGVCLS